MKNIVLIATMLAGAAPAFADDTPNPWGTPEDTDHCTKALTKGSKEYVNIWLTLGHNVNGKYVDKDKFFEGEGATDECKAEVGKRAQQCLKDPAMQPKLKPSNEDNKYTQMLKREEQRKDFIYQKEKAAERAGRPSATTSAR